MEQERELITLSDVRKVNLKLIVCFLLLCCKNGVDNKMLIDQLNEHVPISEKEAYPPVSFTEVSLLENKIGYKLPELLTKFYTEVSNGCKKYEIVGLTEKGHIGYTVEIAGLYNLHQSNMSHGFSPEHFLQFANWSESEHFFVDLTDSESYVYLFLEDNGEDDDIPRFLKIAPLNIWIQTGIRENSFSWCHKFNEMSNIVEFKDLKIKY